MTDDQDINNTTASNSDLTTQPSVDETNAVSENVQEDESDVVEDNKESQADEINPEEETSKPQENPDQTEESAEEITQEQISTDDETVADKVEPSSSDETEKEPETEHTTPKPAPKSEPSGPKAHWYVVHTYSGHEAKVATTLRQRIDSQKLKDKILDILVPTQEKIEIKEGKKNTVKEKIFPGYILIRMVLDDISWLAVRTTPGVTSFVGNANKPTPLSEAEVETIKRFMSMEAPKFKTAFSVGEAVKIIEGPFAEFLGSISEIDEEKGKLKVMVSIFGRETPVELDFLQVNKL